MTVTCTTPACENENIPIEIADTWTDLDGTVHPVEVVQCGVCFEWIIAPVEPVNDPSAESEEHA